MAKSYVVEYWALGGQPEHWQNCLLGGVQSSRSSRWGLLSDAEHYLAGALEINRNAGRSCDGKIVASSLPPDIFPHCPGALSQAIGGKCFSCGQVLTPADAKRYRNPDDDAHAE